MVWSLWTPFFLDWLALFIPKHPQINVKGMLRVGRYIDASIRISVNYPFPTFSVNCSFDQNYLGRGIPNQNVVVFQSGTELEISLHGGDHVSRQKIEINIHNNVEGRVWKW